MVLIFIYFVCSIPYTKIKTAKFERMKMFFLSCMTFDLYANHGHTQLPAASAKCKASSLNNVSFAKASKE